MISLNILWNLKNETNKQNLSSQIQRTDWWLPEGRGSGEWAKWVKGVKMYKLPALK